MLEMNLGQVVRDAEGKAGEWDCWDCCAGCPNGPDGPNDHILNCKKQVAYLPFRVILNIGPEWTR